MSSLNMVQLIGNVGKDVELQYTKSGIALCRVSLATKESWADQSGEKHEQTEWHNIVFWKKQAEMVANNCRKGSKIYVEGKLKTRSWEKNGQMHYATDIQANEVKFLSPYKQREESYPKDSRTRAGKPLSVPSEMGDRELDPDIPF